MLTARDLVDARLYESEQAVVEDALRHLFRARPELRIQVAVHRYQSEQISLSKAAAIAGASWEQMREILLERGVQPRLGPTSVEEAVQEVETLREQLQAP